MTTLIYIYIKVGGGMEANPLKSVSMPLYGQARLHVHQEQSMVGGHPGVRGFAQDGDRGIKCE